MTPSSLSVSNHVVKVLKDNVWFLFTNDHLHGGTRNGLLKEIAEPQGRKVLSFVEANGGVHTVRPSLSLRRDLFPSRH